VSLRQDAGFSTERDAYQTRLEQLPLDILAQWCKRVADKPAEHGESEATDAGKLRRQWFQSEASPNSSVVEQEEQERDQAELKKRMAEFLSRVLLT
jgi:hypothetical protein